MMTLIFFIYNEKIIFKIIMIEILSYVYIFYLEYINFVCHNFYYMLDFVIFYM